MFELPPDISWSADGAFSDNPKKLAMSMCNILSEYCYAARTVQVAELARLVFTTLEKVMVA
jgi:hypothetical protein